MIGTRSARRNLSTKPGVSTPGTRFQKGPALTRRFVLVLVLMLEKWGWGCELWEYCAKSELHPRSGLRLLKGGQIVCAAISFGTWLRETQPTAPLGRGLIHNDIPGVETPGLVLKSLRDRPALEPYDLGSLSRQA